MKSCHEVDTREKELEIYEVFLSIINVDTTVFI